MNLSDVNVGDRVRFRYGFSDGPSVEGVVIKIQPRDADHQVSEGDPDYTRDAVCIQTDDPKVPSCKAWKGADDVELV